MRRRFRAFLIICSRNRLLYNVGYYFHFVYCVVLLGFLDLFCLVILDLCDCCEYHMFLKDRIDDSHCVTT